MQYLNVRKTSLQTVGRWNDDSFIWSDLIDDNVKVSIATSSGALILKLTSNCKLHDEEVHTALPRVGADECGDDGGVENNDKHEEYPHHRELDPLPEENGVVI